MRRERSAISASNRGRTDAAAGERPVVHRLAVHVLAVTCRGDLAADRAVLDRHRRLAAVGTKRSERLEHAQPG